MYKSIVVSCDTYYYMLADDTGIDATPRFHVAVRLRRKTGIDIEGELPGVLPSREWKREALLRQELSRRAPQVVSRATRSRPGIGQGYNAFTPMQLAQAIATLANDGVVTRPHLVESIENCSTGEQRRHRAAS